MTTETLKPWKDSASSFSLGQGGRQQRGRCGPLSKTQAKLQHILAPCQHRATRHVTGRSCDLLAAMTGGTRTACRLATPTRARHHRLRSTKASSAPKPPWTYSRCCHCLHAHSQLILLSPGRLCSVSVALPLVDYPTSRAAPQSLHALHSLSMPSSLAWSPRCTYRRRHAT